MSQRDSGYERKERDLYETPAWVTEALLPHIAEIGSIWEPACASGKMFGVLRRGDRRVEASDIDDGTDFLKEHDKRGVQAIVTNPPYEFAREFIQHALELMRPTGQVAMLLRTDYDHAKTRAHLFDKCPAFAKKIVLTRRIKWFEDSRGQPSFNHAWFIWDWLHKGPPTLAYGP